MNWAEFMGARQLLAEERIGTLLRQVQHDEDVQIARTKAAIRGSR